ncbi:hypothetical protein JZ785_15430 [Alicyclobacillus curvatus]|nr:hypothetical protein JZ785_15430 [Alicyclobacillus curvatus]
MITGTYKLWSKVLLVLGVGVLVTVTAGCGNANPIAVNGGNVSSNVTPNTSNGSGDGSPANPQTLRIVKQRTLTYQIEGQVETKAALAYVSSNQPFYMYVLSGYKATPEEPGKDIVDANANPSAWMRIEVLQPGMTARAIEQDAVNILSATSPSVHAIREKDMPKGTFFANCSAWYANGLNETSLVYVANAQEPPVRFFIHLPKEWESPVQFHSMMETLGLVALGQTVKVSG